jgi:hypothetical protein
MSLFTKRHYDWLSSSLSSEYRLITTKKKMTGDACYDDQLIALNVLIMHMGADLERDNSSFDRVLFIKECHS